MNNKMLVKICGLTDVSEVTYLRENNVDFAGVVLFFEKSKRNVCIEKAEEIVNEIHRCQDKIQIVPDETKNEPGVMSQNPDKMQNGSGEMYQDCGETCGGTGVDTNSSLHKLDIRAVAVTVKPTASQIEAIKNAGFDYIQIHGKVSDEILTNCPLPILKAFNIDDLADYEIYLSFDSVKGFVFDAGEPGSGKPFDWEMLKGFKRHKNKLYILAGGLNAENVHAAIEAVRPDGVDVSSGVEYDALTVGKDPERIKKFVNSARK